MDIAAAVLVLENELIGLIGPPPATLVEGLDAILRHLPEQRRLGQTLI
jgi:hypothetical protein